MTPFEARGWTKDTKFEVRPEECRSTVHQKGTVVWLYEDDGTDCPAFTDGVDYYYYDFWELEPIPDVMSVNGQEGHAMVSPEPAEPVTKDTLFDLKLAGEELVYLAILCGKDSSVIDDNVYRKVSTVLENFADPELWIYEDLYTLGVAINRVFPPQETPEQKQYKELLAQREALDVQLAQLKEKIGG